MKKKYFVLYMEVKWNFVFNRLLTDKIFDDPRIFKKIKEGIENVHNIFNNNLIYNTTAIRDILKLLQYFKDYYSNKSL